MCRKPTSQHPGLATGLLLHVAPTLLPPHGLHLWPFHPGLRASKAPNNGSESSAADISGRQLSMFNFLGGPGPL
jgi:hypothetical protein